MRLDKMAIENQEKELRGKVRMPKGDKSKMANKEVCDLTLAKLRLEANYNKADNHMFIDKKRMRKEKKGWADEMSLSLKAFNRRLKGLEEAGLIVLEENSNYYKLTNEFGAYGWFDVPRATLDMLVRTCQDDVIKVYLYLLGWHISKSKTNEKFDFSLNQLCVACGLTEATKNRKKMFEILFILEQLKLIVIAEEKLIIKQKGRYDNEFFVLEEAKQEIETSGSNLIKAQAKAKGIETPKTLTEAHQAFKF